MNLSHEDRDLIGLGFYAVLAKLENLQHQFHDLQSQVTQTEAHVMLDLTRLTASVDAETTVITSAETLLSTLADEIRAAAGDPVAIAALADTVDQNAAGLAAAVAANTPVVTPPAVFVTKVDGETYVDYQTRLFIFNEGKDVSLQAPALSEADWNAAPVG